MAVRKPGSQRAGSKRNQTRRRQLLQQKQRRLHLENLEPRRLLAQGPQLISVRPNDGDFLREGDVLHNDLVDVTFIFSDGQQINDATLDAISLTRLPSTVARLSLATFLLNREQPLRQPPVGLINTHALG